MKVGTHFFSAESQQAADFVITVDILCYRTDAALDQWRLDVFSAISQGYQKLVGDYTDNQKGQSIRPKHSRGPLGGNSDLNPSKLRKMELKKACIAILTGTDIQFVDSQFDPHNL